MWRMLVHTRWRSYASIVASRPVVPPVLVNWPGFRRAGLLRNSTCSPFPGPRRRGDTDRQPTTLVFGLFVRPGPFANATVHSGSSRPGLSIASQSATQSYVNRQVSSSALTATFISRNRQLKRTVAPASRKTRARVLPGPAALLRNRPECGQAALCHPLPSTPIPAFAPASCHSQRQPQPFQDQCARQRGLHCEFWACGASVEHIGGSSSRVRTKVGLVGRTRLGQQPPSPCSSVQKRKTRGTASRVPIHLARPCVQEVVCAPSFNLPQPGRPTNPCRSKTVSRFMELCEAPSCCRHAFQPVNDSVGHSRGVAGGSSAKASANEDQYAPAAILRADLKAKPCRRIWRDATLCATSFSSAPPVRPSNRLSIACIIPSSWRTAYSSD